MLVSSFMDIYAREIIEYLKRVPHLFFFTLQPKR